MSLSEEETVEGNNNLPHIYVNNDILKPLVLDFPREEKKQPKVYEINGEEFHEDFSDENGTLSAFEIQIINKSDGEVEVKVCETADIYLPVSIQETPYGVIINSNVLLSIDQWNTIVDGDNSHRCVVCDTTISGISDHVNSIMHIQNLEKYQPLKIFDLSITRLIDDVYHCGVCNKCFDKHGDDKHFDSKSHEENMLFATNRAFDVMYDFDIHDIYRNNDNVKSDTANRNADSYHFDRNRILSVSEESSGFNSADGFYDYDGDGDNNAIYLSDNDTDNNDIVDNNVAEFDAEPNEYNDPSYISYASIAKVAAVPEYLYVTIFDKRMKMKYDHWHMLSGFKSGQLYCMVCKKYYQATQKAQHCAQKAHLDRLKCYKFVEDYKSYFIRKIDYKYYHCGICNNLQVVSDLGEHIKSRHKKKVIKAVNSEVVPKKTISNEKNTRNNASEKNVTFPLNFKEPQNLSLQAIDTNKNVPTSSRNMNADTVLDCNEEKSDNVIPSSDIKTGEATSTDYEELIRNYYTKHLNHNTVTHNELKGTNIADEHNEKYTVIDKNDDQRTGTAEVNKEDNATNEIVMEGNNVERTVMAAVNTDNATNKTAMEKTNDEKIVMEAVNKGIATINIDNFANTRNEINDIGMINKSLSINFDSDILINHSGFSIRVSFISYNFVSKIDSDYYCHICDVTACDSDMTSHIKESGHAENLKNIPFDNVYTVHLIRVHGFQNHCAICNAIFNKDLTKDHIVGSNHIKMLTNALSVNQQINQTAIDMNPLSINQTTTGMNHTSMHQPTCGMNQPAMGINQTLMHQPTSSMNQATMDINKTTSELNQAAMVMNHLKMYQPTSSMNQTAMGMNQAQMHQPTFGLNQSAMNQPAIGMNQGIMNQATIGMNQASMHQPLFAGFQRPLPMFNQTMPTNQPALPMNQWPALPPTKGIQYSFSQNTKNHHQIINQISNPNQQSVNLTTVDLNKPAFKQEIMNVNQRKTSLPNLDVDESKIKSNQAMNQPVNDKNQHDTFEVKIDTNQFKTDMNQHAKTQTKPKKIDSKFESVEDMLDLDESLEDAYNADNLMDDCEYFEEKFVFLKLKNTYLKVGLASYNSLIKIGDGTCYCFVCSVRIYGSLKKHIESKNHTNCMDQCKFVSKYDRHLLRQMFLNYHCSICNTIFTRKDINKHITWPMHLHDNKTDKKTRRTNLKSGSTLQNINLQNEVIYLNEKDPETKILVQIEIRLDGQNVKDILPKKNKIIIFEDKVLKISWDAYHGLCKNRSAHRCVLCQRDVRTYEISSHIRSGHHVELLDKFETKHLPHLVRQIDESILNCVICNVEVANKEHIVTDHVSGKRHRKLHDAILDHSRTADSYADCTDDVLHLCSA